MGTNEVDLSRPRLAAPSARAREFGREAFPSAGFAPTSFQGARQAFRSRCVRRGFGFGGRELYFVIEDCLLRFWTRGRQTDSREVVFLVAAKNGFIV